MKMIGGEAAAVCGTKRVMPKRKRSFSRSGGNRKAGKQGSPEHDRDRSYVKYEELLLIDPANLKYAGELAERKSAIQWVYRALGSPPKEQWNSDRGHDGTILIIANRLGLDHRHFGKMIKRTLELIEAGGDVRQRADHERPDAQRMTQVEHKIAADCLVDGMGISQATAMVNGHRWRQKKKALARDLTPDEMRDEEVGRETVRDAAKRMDSVAHKRRSKKSGSSDHTTKWAVASLAQAEQQQTQLKAGSGDSVAMRRCRREGWTPIALAQVAWWDERHRKCILG